MTACRKCGYDEDAEVAARWMFIIERDPPSLNDRLHNAGRWQGSAYRKVRDTWCLEFRAARLRERIPKATGQRRVTITRIFGGRARELDADNWIGGAKALVDAMRIEKLILDDSRSAAQIHYAQRRAIAVEIQMSGAAYGVGGVVGSVLVHVEIEELKHAG